MEPEYGERRHRSLHNIQNAPWPEENPFPNVTHGQISRDRKSYAKLVVEGSKCYPNIVTKRIETDLSYLPRNITHVPGLPAPPRSYEFIIQ